METALLLSQFWLAPIGGAASHDIAPLVAWHARLMVLAWSVLIPLGVLVARFYKVTRRQDFPAQLDNPFWWHAHRGLQYTGVLLALVALGFVFDLKKWSVHAVCGYALLVLGLLQVLGAQWRGTKGGPTDVAKGLPLRGDHFDMTRRRRVFEWWHKRLGYAALALVVATTVLGLALADAPRWMCLVIGLWWMLLLAAFIHLQGRGRAVDTYTAIWGKPFKGNNFTGKP
jgi:hypothetical protein